MYAGRFDDGIFDDGPNENYVGSPKMSEIHTKLERARVPCTLVLRTKCKKIFSLLLLNTAGGRLRPRGPFCALKREERERQTERKSFTGIPA